jgi:hypothetical protein
VENCAENKAGEEKMMQEKDVWKKCGKETGK